MTAAPFAVTPETPLSEVWSAMEQRGIRHFPVVEDGRLVGLLSERHFRDAMPSILTVDDPAARQRFLRVTLVGQVAVRDPATCPPDAPLTSVITTMRRFRAGALPVMDGGRVAGIVTSGDLLTLLQRLLDGAA